MRVIGYTYEAAYHCVDCTRKMIAAILPASHVEAAMNGDFDYLDGEGNPIHPVFSTDECEDEHCDDCGGEIS